MPKLDFIPERDGFHFRNSFVNHVLDGPIRIETVGRCGAWPPLPSTTGGPAYPSRRMFPPISLGATLAVSPRRGHGSRPSSTIGCCRPSSGQRGSSSSLGPWVTDADCYQWSMNDEFPKFRRRVDADMLSVVGLWSRQGGVGEGHQIVCYGYEADPSTLWVYDNNYPDLECRLVGLGPEQGVAVERPDGGRSAYRGYYPARHHRLRRRRAKAALHRPRHLAWRNTRARRGGACWAAPRLHGHCQELRRLPGAATRPHPFPTRPGRAEPRRPARRPRQLVQRRPRPEIPASRRAGRTPFCAHRPLRRDRLVPRWRRSGPPALRRRRAAAALPAHQRRHARKRRRRIHLSDQRLALTAA
jgi:hypothetical protein